MITVETFTFNDFHENTYLLFDETKECVMLTQDATHHQSKPSLNHLLKTIDLNLYA